MPDFIPLSSQNQDYAARQNDARRADEDDIRRRAMDLRKRQAENQSKASTQLQQEVEQDADTFASFLTGESEGAGQSEKAAGSPFDVPRGQEDLESAGDIFSQLLRQGADGLEGKEGKDSEVSGGERDASIQGGEGDAAQQSDSMETSPFSNPFMSWGSAGRQEQLESAHSADNAESSESVEGEADTENASESDGPSGGSGDSSVDGSSGGDGETAAASFFGFGGTAHTAGAQGRGGAGDSGGQGGDGSADGFDRAAQEAAALNVASLQSSLLNAMQRPGAAGINDTDDAAGVGGAKAAELIEKLGSEVVERLLVTDPQHQTLRQEVRLKIRDSVLKDTEVRVYRDGDEVHVEFVTPSEESAQTLSQNASDLEATLRERLGASGVVVKIDKTDPESEA